MLGIVAAYVCRHASFADPDLRSVAGAIWAYLVDPVVYALVSVGVGSLLRSNGAAIGVSLGFALGGGLLTGARRQLRQRDGRQLPAAGRGADRGLARPPRRHLARARLRAVAVWLIAIVGAGLWRTLLDEY